jgi:hypothetical protein
MTISMYQASAPSLVRSLQNLINILEEAAADAETRKTCKSSKKPVPSPISKQT